MKRDDFIQAVAVELNDDTPKAQIRRILEAAGEVGLSILEDHELTVPLFGLGKIIPVKRAARKGRNPRTGEALDLPVRNGAKFQPGKAAKEALK